MLILEHDGTESSNELFQELSDLLEYKFGYSTEQLIGEGPGITLYEQQDNSELKRITEFQSLPDEQSLRFILDLCQY